MTVRETCKSLFLVRYTYRVNTILYAIKQIPLVKRILPETWYAKSGLKTAVAVLAVTFGFLTAFAIKAAYMLLAIFPLLNMERGPSGPVVLQTLLLLALLGSYINTPVYEASPDRSYVIFLLRMDAKRCVLTWLGYDLLHSLLGFWVPCVFLSFFKEPSVLWMLFPFFVVGIKLLGCMAALWRFRVRGGLASGVRQYLPRALAVVCCLSLAYSLPFCGFCLPVWGLAIVMLTVIAAGAYAAWRLAQVPDYRAYCQAIQARAQMQSAQANVQIAATNSRKAISEDTNIRSDRTGLAYLHDLFVKRHRKLLWHASKLTALVCGGVAALTMLSAVLLPEYREEINPMLRQCLPMMPFLLFFLNRGSGFTQALFMNCDHSLLTYAFFKQPKNLLRLFRIRLAELIKVNLLPATVIAVGLTGLLATSGGAARPLDYVVLPVTILALNIFFSVHHLTLYYLLQPYNAGTELKSGTYTAVHVATYVACLILKDFRASTLLFGGLAILFCACYCAVSCFLVYRIAPRTFRLRK